MLRINIIAVGKNKDNWVDESVSHYLKLLKKYASVTIDYLPDKSAGKSLSEIEIMRKEGDLIMARIKSNYPVALWDKGRKMDSVQFSKWLSKLMQKSGGGCDMIIGGAYGLDRSVLESSREIVSLSPLTMSHQLIRPVFLEQLYRGFSILSGGKYHK